MMVIKLKHIFVLLLSMASILSSYAQTKAIIKIGLIADPQYQGAPGSGERQYRESLWKLNEAIDTFNYYEVDFIQNLGDMINGEWRSFDSILPVYKKVSPDIETYHLLGNHDFSIDSIQMADLLETLSMPDCYYSYVKKDWRFIVLDATDYSYYANPLHNHHPDKIDEYYASTDGLPNHYDWNGGIGQEQQVWLKEKLDSAKSLNQKVIIFSHMPLRPEHATNLWNSKEIVDIIESSSNVKAFINGHRHEGGYAFENGIHYITIYGMVNTMISSYGILEIYKDHLVLKGFGNQIDYQFRFHSGHTDPLSVVQKDWLLEVPSVKSRVHQKGEKELILSNGLISRTIRITPNAATISLKNLVTQEEYIRSVKPEALVTINGTSYPVGGLSGQKEHGYLQSEWLESMQSMENAFLLHEYEIREMTTRIQWKQWRQASNFYKDLRSKGLYMNDYDAHMTQNYESGVQACYRGPRLYDTEETRELVIRHINHYKKYREILNADIIHLRRPDGRDWDGILHVDPQSRIKEYAMLYNPTSESMHRSIVLPLYYTGLSHEASITIGDQQPAEYSISRDYEVIR